MPTLDAPIPIIAAVSAPLTITTVFSHPILPAVLDIANWTARLANSVLNISAANVVAGDVEISGIPGGVDIGPDQVTYSPPPFDVVSDTFKPTPAPAFADFLLT